ncbi:hypothetical protein ABZ814_30660, partial [Micromonospora musae]|uniref:hypothetical protein n=1 Tax=Micromonospora musae TaxID=1894970 RepID=UPI0033C41839
SARADFETVTRAGWREVSNSYVIPTHDLSLTGTVAEQLAERADRVFRVPGNHAPFWSNVTEFADLLVKIDGLDHASR